MLRNQLKIALRHLWRNRLFTTINVLGLSVGLAFVLLIFTIHHTLLTTDGFHQNRDRIYVVQEASAGAKPAQVTVAPLLPLVLQTLPDVEAGTRILQNYSLWVGVGGNEFNESVAYVDPGIFDVFTFPLRYGDPKTALSEPNSIVLSESVSQKVYGATNPVGKPFQMGDQSVVVRGVLEKIPANATFSPNILLPISALAATDPNRLASWYNTNAPTYLLLRANSDPARVAAQFPTIVQQHYAPEGRNRTLSLLPFTDIISEQRGPSYVVILWGIVFIGLFILLIVSINFLNLTSAASLARSPEVAMRATLGASRRQVVGQFLLEALLIASVSVGLGLLLLQAALPAFLAYFEATFLPLAITPTVIGVAVGMVFFTALVAGVAPALHLTRLPLMRSLRGKTTVLTRTPVRNVLVVVQFMLAVVMMAAVLIMQQQSRFIRHLDPGFALNDVVVCDLDLDYRDPATATTQVNSVIANLRANPDVASLSTSQVIPSGSWGDYNDFAPAGKGEDANVKLQWAVVDEGFLNTYQIRLHEGRGLSSQFSGDGKAGESSTNVLINRRAMERFGWTSAVGKQIRANSGTYTVVGVTNDFYYRGTNRDVQPVVLFGSGAARREGNGYLSIRARSGRAPALIETLKRDFGKIPSRWAFSPFYAQNNFDKLYWVLDKTLRFNALAAFLTLLLSCAGLFGLSSFATQQRTREIGIRKVLGAKVGSIVWLLSKRMLLRVGVSFVLAAPLVYLMMTQWLRTFPLQISFPWLTVSVAGLLAALIAFLTTSYLSVRAATANPVESLRTE